jgi:hypothetical protein
MNVILLLSLVLGLLPALVAAPPAAAKPKIVFVKRAFFYR